MVFPGISFCKLEMFFFFLSRHLKMDQNLKYLVQFCLWDFRFRLFMVIIIVIKFCLVFLTTILYFITPVVYLCYTTILIMIHLLKISLLIQHLWFFSILQAFQYFSIYGTIPDPRYFFFLIVIDNLFISLNLLL